jgi:riboflavin synthase
MFTGIITARGEVRDLHPIGAADMRLAIATPPGWLDGAALGASIACNGCCLTMVAREGDSFHVEASAETLSRTTLGHWRAGTAVNLERSLRAGDELGGHLVYGHVDAVTQVLDVTPEHGSARWRFAIPAGLARYIAVKGSIALDGVSLTVNDVDPISFGVNIIAHTTRVTGFASLAPGDRLNLEIDMLARYVARLQDTAA